MYSFSRTEGWYDGRPVAAGSTPSKLISAKSSASTKTSITRTGLLSSMKSSRHSGNSVHCPRSASSTKRLINSPQNHGGNHNSGVAFSHSQGHFRTHAVQQSEVLFDHLVGTTGEGKRNGDAERPRGCRVDE